MCKKALLSVVLSFITIMTAFGQADFFDRLADSALTLTGQAVFYDPSYRPIDYPDGDIPSDRGVCSDVIIRAYRMFGMDLQKLVHEDMAEHFGLYPDDWGLTHPDKNIDHRRVPNLMVFFSRFGEVLDITDDAADYLPGDIVCWDLGAGVKHIGIVSGRMSADGKRYQVVHNIGAGQVLEDMLFGYCIIGHYRYMG